VPATAKTDIFGDGREFSLTYGDDVAVGHFGFQPLTDQMFSWGASLTAVMDDSEVDENLHAEDWLAGLYVEHPVLDVASIIPNVGINAEIFGGLEIQNLIGTGDILFTPYVGTELRVSENVLIRMDYRFNRRDSIVEQNILSAGVCIHW
jgi:hypothetical protein